MMGKSFGHLRPPIDLPQHRRNACVASVVAQALYVLGKSAKPNPQAIDRAGSHKRGMPVLLGEAYAYLLAKGVHCHVFSDPWPEEHMAKVRPYTKNSHFVWAGRTAKPNDVYQMIQRGWVIDATIEGSRTHVQHAILIVPHSDYLDGEKVWGYAPKQVRRKGHQSVREVFLKPLVEDWLALDSITTGFYCR